MRSGRCGPALAIAHQRFSLCLRLFRSPRAHLHQQKSNAGRQQIELLQREPLAAHEFDEQMIEALEPDRTMFERQRNGIGGKKPVGESKHGQHAKGRAGGEIQLGRNNGGARALTPHQRARNVEAVLRQQFVKVVAGDAPRNARKLLANQLCVAIAQASKAGVDLSHSAATLHQRIQLLRAGAAHGHSSAVVEHDIKRLDVIHDFAAKQPVHAATVVADHAAQRAARVRRRIGRVGQVMLLRRVAQPVENDARLDRRKLRVGIDRSEPVHVARKIEDHRHIGALPRQARARAARQHSCSRRTAGSQRSFHVGCVARKNDAHRAAGDSSKRQPHRARGS